MYYTLEEVIQQAKEAKAKYGYTTTAVICKTWFSSKEFGIGFHFGEGESVGNTGIHPSGNKFEVIALV